jgi:hypothetical protein
MPERAPEVEQFVRGWLDAKQAGDPAGIRAALSEYDGTLAVGTDGEEWWSGTPRFGDAHAGGAPFTATIEHVEAHREGPVAWAAIRAVIETGEPGGLGIRLTLVLVGDGDAGWRIVQSHASATESA